jgi:hypothetical protein
MMSAIASVVAAGQRPAGGAPAGPPEMVSATVQSSGTAIHVVMSRACEFGTGGDGGWAVTSAAAADGYMSGVTAPNVAYASGSGTGGDPIILTVSARTINDSLVETITLDYTNPGDGLRAADDEQEVDDIEDAAVTNSSTARGHRTLQEFATTSATWGVGYNGTANGLTDGWARSGHESWPATCPPTGLELYCDKRGSGSLPSQPVYGFFMSGAGAPDAFIGSGLSAARDASADVPAKDSPAWMRFAFTGVGSITSGTRVHLGMTTAMISGGDYIGWRTQTFGSQNLYGRAGDYPQASGDAGNWVSTDTTGRVSHRILVSPQASGSP